MHDTPAWLLDLARHSDTAALMAAHDWASTPIGPPETWPESLRVAVGLCLSSDFPILVAWGPDLVMIYNEGYRALLGDKHPAAVGVPVRVAWAEAWDELAPLFAHVTETGTPYNAQHYLLLAIRNGYLEEMYFTFCYSPIVTDGRVAGTLDIAMETTTEVVADRRLSLLGALGASMVAARDVTDVCTAAVSVLGDKADVVTAEVWLWVGGTLVQLATSGRIGSDRITEEVLGGIEGPTAVVLDPAWDPGTPARRVAQVVGSGEAAGVLVLELNPRRPFDDGHRSFVELLGRTVGAALDNAYRRSVELGEQRLIGDTLQAAMLAPASDLPTVAARYRPAAGQLSVGGDWYDVITLGDGRRALVVGDCVGHGLQSATAMGQLRSASRALLLEGRRPQEVVEAMDLFAASVPGGHCATMVCAVIDLERRTATYSSAGHPAPLLVHEGRGAWLDGGRGTPLGVEGHPRDEAVADIEPDDLLVMFSDGLVERRGEDIDDGLDRLRRAVEAHATQPVQSIADDLIDEVLPDRPGDDVALLVKRIH